MTDCPSKRAILFESLSGSKVRCHLCAHRCVIPEGRSGICGVRVNRSGELRTLVHGRTASESVDPIEKKPLHHFQPGSTTYSIATPGCNFHCRWCQNAALVHMPLRTYARAGRSAEPGEIVAAAALAQCRSIAYTYTEPTVFCEYALDTARLAHSAGLANVFVTNGYMTPEMLDDLCPYLDAANVDLKSFSDSTYRKLIGATLAPVLDAVRILKSRGVWLEVTTLVVPGVNDSTEELRRIAQFVASELGRETPWHVSRFFPAGELTGVAPTPLATLDRARRAGVEAGLHHVYIGNAPGAADTLCWRCGRLLIRRIGYVVSANSVTVDGACPDCGARVAGVDMAG